MPNDLKKLPVIYGSSKRFFQNGTRLSSSTALFEENHTPYTSPSCKTPSLMESIKAVHFIYLTGARKARTKDRFTSYSEHLYNPCTMYVGHSLYVQWISLMFQPMHTQLNMWYKSHIYPAIGPWCCLQSECTHIGSFLPRCTGRLHVCSLVTRKRPRCAGWPLYLWPAGRYLFSCITAKMVYLVFYFTQETERSSDWTEVSGFFKKPFVHMQQSSSLIS